MYKNTRMEKWSTYTQPPLLKLFLTSGSVSGFYNPPKKFKQQYSKEERTSKCNVCEVGQIIMF